MADFQAKRSCPSAGFRTRTSSFLFIIKELDATAFQVGEDDGSDGLDDDGGAEGETDIVTARNVEGGLLAGLDVEGGLGFGDAGGRLEGYTKYYRRAVRDTAVDAAGTVLHGGHRTFFKLKRVIMFRAFHPGGCETVTELYATDSRDGEHSMRNQGLDRIEERFSKTGRNSGDPTLDNAAKRIAFLGGFVQEIVPL